VAASGLEVLIALRCFECFEHAPPNLRRLRQRLQARCVPLPFLVTEIGVLRAGREQQIVVLELAAVGHDRAAVDIDALGLGLQHADIAHMREQAADRDRDIRGAERRHRDLVQQRLEQMMILAIEQRHSHAGHVAQPLGRIDARETRADDEDLLHSSRCSHAQSTMGCTRGETRREAPW
jgi:hypothetical protein